MIFSPHLSLCSIILFFVQGIYPDPIDPPSLSTTSLFRNTTEMAANNFRSSRPLYDDVYTFYFGDDHGFTTQGYAILNKQTNKC